MVNAVALAVFVLSLSLGQLLFKASAPALAGRSLANGFAALAATPAFYAALLLYGASTLLWVWILARVPLSTVYPFVSLAIILVPLMASAVFGDQLSARYWTGVCLICIGIGIMQT